MLFSFFFFAPNWCAFVVFVLCTQEAQSSKAPIQAFADRVSSIFAPVVLSLATVSFFAWYVRAVAVDTSLLCVYPFALAIVSVVILYVL